MASKNTLIRVMISSRCDDTFPEGGRSLSAIRRHLKAEIEAAVIFDQSLYEVWINEEESPREAELNSLDVCLEQARTCDVFISLYNGNAGWTQSYSGTGICHDELRTALEDSPAKVRLVATIDPDPSYNSGEKRDADFAKYIQNQNIFRGGLAKTEAQLIDRVKQAIHDTTLRLLRSGKKSQGKGKYDRGQALEWNRLSFQERRIAIRECMADFLGSQIHNDDFLIVRDIPGLAGVIANIDAIPGPLTVAAARELISQPFRNDHLIYEDVKNHRGIGPIHIIGCHKSVTEQQAANILGVPDSTSIATSFGVIAIDLTQHVQMAFISGCSDEASTRSGVQAFLSWLDQTSEQEGLRRRAKKRKQITKAIAESNK
jgi:hypothetical protein